jgi:hypothetical protein
MISVHHDMSNQNPPIYPSFTFSASPTWFAWVKLTAADVHGLRTEPAFEGKHLHPISVVDTRLNKYTGQNVFFHYNHPIRYISLVAPVVSIEDMYGKYALLTLDDGSGKNIVVKITRLQPQNTNPVDYPTNTNVDNLNIVTNLSRFDVVVENTVLDIGTVVKVKCTVSEFRNVKQLDLQRIRVVETTEEEVEWWEEVIKWKRDVLGSPWKLSQEQIAKLNATEAKRRMKRREEEQAAEEKARQKALRRAKRAEKRKQYEEKAEMKRRKEELEMNRGALI